MSTQFDPLDSYFLKILAEVASDKNKYDPLRSNINRWICSMEIMFAKQGIVNTERPLVAAKNIEGEFGTELYSIVEKAEADFGPIGWDQFKNFMIAFNDNLWKKLLSLREFNRFPISTLVIMSRSLVTSFIADAVPDSTSKDSYASLVRSLVDGDGTQPGIYSLLKSPGEDRNNDELVTGDDS